MVVPVSATKKKHIHLQFLGFQECLNGSVSLWNILQPLHKHCVGSTLTEFTLRDLGVFVPDATVFPNGFVYCPVADELDTETAAHEFQ